MKVRTQDHRSSIASITCSSLSILLYVFLCLCVLLSQGMNSLLVYVLAVSELRIDRFISYAISSQHTPHTPRHALRALMMLMLTLLSRCLVGVPSSLLVLCL